MSTVRLRRWLGVIVSICGIIEIASGEVTVVERKVGSVRGPEGLVVAPDQTLFVSEVPTGMIKAVLPNGRVVPIRNLTKDFACEVIPLGLAIDRNLDLYAAVQGVEGGSVVKIPHQAAGGTFSYGFPQIVRSRLGHPNGIAIDSAHRLLYVSDSGNPLAFGLLGGRVWRFNLRDAQPRPTRATESLARLHFANGLALGPGGRELFVCQTYRGPLPGRLTSIALTKSRATPKLLRSFRGWPDGIVFDPTRRALHIALQRAGKIVSTDLQGNPLVKLSNVPELHVDGRRCAPASVTVLGNGEIVFTDFWDADVLKIALARRYHDGIFLAGEQRRLRPPSSQEP